MRLTATGERVFRVLQPVPPRPRWRPEPQHFSSAPATAPQRILAAISSRHSAGAATAQARPVRRSMTSISTSASSHATSRTRDSATAASAQTVTGRPSTRSSYTRTLLLRVSSPVEVVEREPCVLGQPRLDHGKDSCGILTQRWVMGLPGWVAEHGRAA